MKGIFCLALAVVAATAFSSSAIAAEHGALAVANQNPKALENAGKIVIQGVIVIQGLIAQGGHPAFAAFVRRNPGKYASCADLTVQVGINDGSVNSTQAVGDINSGKCAFEIVHIKRAVTTYTFGGGGGGGACKVRFVQLLNPKGQVLSIRRPKRGSSFDVHELLDVSFTFQKIEFEYKLGKSFASDDWKQ